MVIEMSWLQIFLWAFVEKVLYMLSVTITVLVLLRIAMVT